MGNIDDAFYVVSFVFDALISCLGVNFNYIIKFAILAGAISTVFGLGISAIRSAKRSKSD